MSQTNLVDPRDLGNPGLPAGLREADISPPPAASKFDRQCDAADRAERLGRENLETQAINLLSTLRSRLPDGCRAVVKYEVGLSDDDQQHPGARAVIWTFGAHFALDGQNTYECECWTETRNVAEMWCKIDCLVHEVAEKMEYAAWRKAQSIEDVKQEAAPTQPCGHEWSDRATIRNTDGSWRIACTICNRSYGCGRSGAMPSQEAIAEHQQQADAHLEAQYDESFEGGTR